MELERKCSLLTRPQALIRRLLGFEDALQFGNELARVAQIHAWFAKVGEGACVAKEETQFEVNPIVTATSECEKKCQNTPECVGFTHENSGLCRRYHNVLLKETDHTIGSSCFRRQWSIPEANAGVTIEEHFDYDAYLHGRAMCKYKCDRRTCDEWMATSTEYTCDVIAHSWGCNCEGCSCSKTNN